MCWFLLQYPLLYVKDFYCGHVILIIWKRERQYIDKEWHKKEYLGHTYIFMKKHKLCSKHVYSSSSHTPWLGKFCLGLCFAIGREVWFARSEGLSSVVKSVISSGWLLVVWSTQTPFSLIPFSLTLNHKTLKIFLCWYRFLSTDRYHSQKTGGNLNWV